MLYLVILDKTRNLIPGIRNMPIRTLIKASLTYRCLSIFNREQRRKLVKVGIAQASLGVLDLIGVAIIGLLTVLALSGITSEVPNSQIQSFLVVFGLNNFNFQMQVAILGSIAALILIGRTIFSIILSRKILFFLSYQSAKLSGDLISKLLAQPLLLIREKSSQELVYAATTGVSTIAVGILGVAIMIASDLTLLFIIGFGLVALDPLTAISLVAVFAIISIILRKVTLRKATQLGAADAKLSITSNEEILEVLENYRETVVKNRRYFYATQIGKLRMSLAKTLAEIAFMPNISKYMTETALIIGAVLISGLQFWLQDAKQAFATLAVFLASGLRLAPAILRIQQGITQIKVGSGSALSTLDLIEKMKNVHPLFETNNDLIITHTNFHPEIVLKNVTLKYPENENNSLESVHLKISSGEFIAIVGESGAGKTTLVDILLGIIEPTSGSIEISGLTPLASISKWPGAIAYVPQNGVLLNGSIKKNVCLGFDEEEVDDELVWDALRIAQLESFVQNSRGQLQAVVGEKGGNLSGGQKQRLCIARALLTKPRLVVLDEATSALDGTTELIVSESIQSLRGTATVVTVAHRLSTVRNADKVVYMKQGKILAIETFDNLRIKFPDFDQQAKLMGL
jgi:ABC-type multidrug transport system fused ATPase/permease subunit